MEKKKTIEPGIAIRIIAIPVMLLFALFWSMRTLIKFLIDYVRYGGEMIVYSKQSSRTTILDCFEKLVEIQKKEAEQKTTDPEADIKSSCSTCKHAEKGVFTEPCSGCISGKDMWEADEEIAHEVLMSKFCSNCKHVETRLSEKPCVKCGGQLRNWEPQEKKNDNGEQH